LTRSGTCSNHCVDPEPELLTKSESFQGGGTPELCFSDDDFDMVPDCHRYVAACSILFRDLL
jgi:hypothetical protein